MAVWWGLSGTASVSRTETATLTGTATVTADPDVYVEGTATVDRTSLHAWAAQFRRTATRVLMGDEGEDMVRVQGDVTVNVDGGSPCATASFQLPDPRCGYFAEGSLATGGVPVTIRCRISTDVAEADTVVFRGLTEAAPNAGAYVPTATIQCAGEGSEWLESKGCLNIAAFSEMTRLDALRALAESVGIDPARIICGEETGTIRLPWDLANISPWELAGRICQLEDLYRRVIDGNLELLPARAIVGPEANPVFDFTGDNSYPFAETPPNRPVTVYHLSATGIPAEILTGGTEVVTPSIRTKVDAYGVIVSEIRTLTTTVNGVMTRQRVEEWRDAPIPGVTPSASAFRLWQLTETDSTYLMVTVEGVSLRTARVAEQRTTVSGWYSPPCRTADGYVWSDNTRHLAAAATWQVISTSVTTPAYDPDSCVLLTRTTRRGGWYSPLVASGETYDDGAIRAAAAYAWIPETADPPYELVEEVNAESTSDALKTALTESFLSKLRVPPTSSAQVDEWCLASGDRSLWSTVPGSGLVMVATYVLNEDGTSDSKSEPYTSEFPTLERAAADIPQYRTVPLTLNAEADGSRFAISPKAEPVWGAETMDDLITVALRRFRDEHSPRATIPHPALPLLKLLDVVTADDAARNLDARPCYVEQFQLLLNASETGALGQQTVVVFPLAAYDPGSQVVTS
ncbi:MAG TPA: hypothetical protein DCQ64_19305 [Candidatus Rokubacteria bacterium]|nr:hypothetical protein [Candidatus Rokubacteria bacterium]